jgi:hypothetical protein
VRWVKKKTGPAAADVADKDALTDAEKGAEVLAIGYFKDLKVGVLGCGLLRSLRQPMRVASRHDLTCSTSSCAACVPRQTGC